MADRALLHLDVQLELGAETIHGTLSDSDHPLINFTGWLELMSAFDTATARATSRSTQPASSDQP